MKSITVQELQKRMASGDENKVLLDVRDAFEYRGEAIPNAENMPYDTLEETAEKLRGVDTVYVHCNTGRRSSQACQLLEQKGINVVNVEGGIEAWKDAGLEIKGKSGRIPLMRQTMIAAGFLILLSTTLGLYVAEWWYYLALLVGAGLMFGGVTGICSMTAFLRYMPWNK